MSTLRRTPQSIDAIRRQVSALPRCESQVPPENAAQRPGGGMRSLTGSTSTLCIAADAHGGTLARGEWEIAFCRETDRIEAGARVLTHERLRFRADAGQLRVLAIAMLAGAKELEAIEAHMTPVKAGSRVDLDYLETITLAGDGIGPSYDSPLYVERSG